jgi:hypothetical protein
MVFCQCDKLRLLLVERQSNLLLFVYRKSQTPTRVLPGTMNDTKHLQSVLAVMVDNIRINTNVWLNYSVPY